MRITVASIAVAAILFSGAGHAGDPVPFRDFTFKRVLPPPPDATRRILVRIEPPEVAKPDPPLRSDAIDPPTASGPAAGGAYGWFWDAMPGAARLDAALNVLARPPEDGPSPFFRLDALRRIADRHGRDILAATVGTRVSPALVLAAIAVESGGRTDAVSPAGAVGIMQLMPATARRFGVADRRRAGDSIRGGVRYLDWLMGEFDRDPLLVLAGYNAGEGAVARHGGVPPYAETRGYVPKVLAAFGVARGLCRTPPVLATDGCVFIAGRSEG